MEFGELTINRFLRAREEASIILEEAGVKQRNLTLDQTLVMSATTCILSEKDEFYGLELVQLMDAHHPPVYRALRKFELVYGILKSECETDEEASSNNRLARRLYQQTDLGLLVFKLFE